MSAYWNSSWSGEDGGPKRQQVAANVSIPRIVNAQQLDVRSRDALAMTMPIVGPNDELFLQRAMPGLNSVAWIEKIDPLTLEQLAQSLACASNKK